MKKHYIAPLAIGTILAVGIIIGCATDSAETQTLGTQWHRSMNDATKQAQQQNKPILCVAFTKGCHWCAMLKEKTLANAAVQKKLDDYVLLVVNNFDHRDMLDKWGVVGYPTSIVLNVKGEPIYAQPGYAPPEKYLNFLSVGLQRFEAAKVGDK